MYWVKMLLVDAPAFVIGTWLRLYCLVLAFICFMVWGIVIVTLVQAAWQALR